MTEHKGKNDKDWAIRRKANFTRYARESWNPQRLHRTCVMNLANSEDRKKVKSGSI